MTDTDTLYMASLEKRNAELEARVAELEEKHWNECRQIAHYDDERKKIREYLQHSAKTMTVHGVLEALALIGEDTNVPASADDTNVGHKSGGWISVKDRLPENCIEVLVYDTDCGIVMGWYDKEIGDFAADFISPLDAVTHWIPLPEPPKDGDTE